MLKLLEYFARFQAVKGSMGRLPGWAKWIVFLFALPGIVGIALSIVALLVSLFALLLLAMPVFRVMKALVGNYEDSGGPAGWEPDERQVHEVESRDVTDEVDAASENASMEVKSGVLEEVSDGQPQRPRRSIEVTIIE